MTRFEEFPRQLETIVPTARRASSAVADVMRGMDGASARAPVITELPARDAGLLAGERCTTAADNMMTHRISLVHSIVCRISVEVSDAETSTASLLGATAGTLGREALLVSGESRRLNSAARSKTAGIAEWTDPRPATSRPR
jgi:hypothetical protein